MPLSKKRTAPFHGVQKFHGAKEDKAKALLFLRFKIKVYVCLSVCVSGKGDQRGGTSFKTKERICLCLFLEIRSHRKRSSR